MQQTKGQIASPAFRKPGTYSVNCGFAHSLSLRDKVRGRDREVCRFCGLDCRALRIALAIAKSANVLNWEQAFPAWAVRQFPRHLWEVHEVHPRAQGGNDNLHHGLWGHVTACLPCHRKQTRKVFYKEN